MYRESKDPAADVQRSPADDETDGDENHRCDDVDLSLRQTLRCRLVLTITPRCRCRHFFAGPFVGLAIVDRRSTPCTRISRLPNTTPRR